MVPSSWQQVQIGELCGLINGRAFKPTDWTPDGLPIVRIQNLKNPDAPLNRYDGEIREQFLIDDGQLLFAWSGTPGTSFGAHIWQGGPAILNQHIFRIEFDDALIDKAFFRHAINDKVAELIGRAHGGVGLAHVTKGVFEETVIGLPPLAEQRRIVAKLDALTARTARARADLDRIPALASRYKKIVLAKAFSGELTAAWRLKRAAGEPKPSRLADLVSAPIRNGLSVRGSDDPPGVRSLRLSALRGGQVNMDDVRFLPISSDKADRFLLEEGDILISRGNGTKALVGICALVPSIKSPTIFPDTAFRLRAARDQVVPRWLTYIWSAPQVRAQVEAIAKTTAGIWKVSQGDLAGIELTLVDKEEQVEIVRRVDAAFAEIDRLTTEAAAARRLLDRLDQAIMAKAFRGELVPQDPADEPANVLLERIRTERAAAPKAKRGRPSRLGNNEVEAA